LILLVAAAFRFYGLAWDGGYLFHPDERKILLVASELRLPANVFEFFSADSPLNPKFFAYGSFPIYLVKILGVFAPTPALAVPWREDFVGMALLGRALSALFDLGTIALTFLLARRLYDAATGLIASAAIAVTVLHIQLSHFYAVDTLLTLLVVATMYFAARFAQTRARRDALAAGIAFGLALATKVSAAPLIVPIVFVVTTADRRPPTTDIRAISGQRSAVVIGRKALARIWNVRRELIRILVVALAAFIVTQPYALLDPIRYFGQIGTESLVARGWLDYPYTRQYADTLPFVYPIVQSSIWGMGLPLGIFAWLGSALFVYRFWRARDHALSGVEGWRDGFILSWSLVYFLIVGAQYAKYLRYLLPLTPFLFLMAASAFKVQGSRFAVAPFTHHASRFTHHASRLTPHAILPTVYCLLLTFSLVYTIAFTSLYAREHPWLTISRWMYANVPARATIAVEHWDDALPVPMRFDDATRAPSEYKTITLPMYDDDNAAKLEMLVAALRDADYIVLATQRLSAPLTRLPQRYPITSRYYRALFDGQLGFDLAASAVNGIALDGLVIADERFDGLAPPFFAASDALVWNWGRADESFTVYDHPLPLVFKKTRALARDELRARLLP
jgi:4-amino-4-deoxy-L-arabinose transferase-like glycosyltransferase